LTAEPAAPSTASAKEAPWGIHALPLDYEPLRDYVDKTESIFAFEREGRCVVCAGDMPVGEGLYAVCSNNECEGVGHLDCWSRHLLAQRPAGDDDGNAVLPVHGHCPECRGEVRWGNMMAELSLRARGGKEVEKLLKKRRAGTNAA
jgi:structure-specific endonuclease subunit SLX1